VAHRRARHRGAGLGAAPAQVRASTHRLVVFEALAARRATLAHFRADAANVWVKLGASNHESGCGAANLRAVEEQADVLRRRVSAALVQAVDKGV
jgi:hypothetical protein